MLKINIFPKNLENLASSYILYLQLEISAIFNIHNTYVNK